MFSYSFGKSQSSLGPSLPVDKEPGSDYNNVLSQFLLTQKVHFSHSSLVFQKSIHFWIKVEA